MKSLAKYQTSLIKQKNQSKPVYLKKLCMENYQEPNQEAACPAQNSESDFAHLSQQDIENGLDMDIQGGFQPPPQDIIMPSQMSFQDGILVQNAQEDAYPVPSRDYLGQAFTQRDASLPQLVEHTKQQIVDNFSLGLTELNQKQAETDANQGQAEEPLLYHPEQQMAHQTLILGPVDSQNPFGESQIHSQNMETEVANGNRSQKADSQKVIGRSPMKTRFNGKKVPHLTNNDSSSATPSRSSRRFNIKDSEAQNKEKYIDTQNNLINSQRKPSNPPEDETMEGATPKPKQIGKTGTPNGRNENLQKSKKSGHNLFQECLKSYQNMFQFDWDLKEFANSRHSPRDDLTAGAFWFYINTTYFPYDLQFKVTEQEFEEWAAPLLKKLNTFSFPINSTDKTDQKQKQNYQICYDNQLIDNQFDQPLSQQNDEDTLIIDPSDKDPDLLLNHVTKLIGKRKKFNRFKKHFRTLKERAAKHPFHEDEMREIQSEASKIPRINQSNDDGIDEEIAEIKQNIDLQNFQKMVALAEKDLKAIQSDNLESLKSMFNGVKKKYEAALSIDKDSDKYRDKTLYKPEEIYKYGHSFISYVEPSFTQDMVTNIDWYRENLSFFLLNINYPCKLQIDFLKELELSQQRMNEMRYRKIMDQMDQLDMVENQDETHIAKREELERDIKNLTLKQRVQLAQDDACCAICSSGDYEDDDQIVFCVHCNMPVHQSCFGIEKLPEIDWMCYNCLTFGIKKGMMVKCFLCPKRGGAMKPTNIFQTYQKFFDSKILGNQKKSGKSNIEKQIKEAQMNSQLLVEPLDSQDGGKVTDSIQAFKLAALSRQEKNTSLNELLQREENYKQKMYEKYYKEFEAIEAAKKRGEAVLPQFSDASKNMLRQDDFELNFNKHEKQNHCIPEDYCHFLQKNETKLEDKNTPVTDTLYHWVHHSCSLWMPGPQVTPRTPVKMNKLDYSKFNIGCVICCKKGPNIGAVIKCTKQDCRIYFHVECAKRANYCMEIEKKNGVSREKVYKIFCESHRPFKIIQEINEQNAQEVEDIQKFTKTIEKCMDIWQKHQQKPKKLISKTERNKLLRNALQNKKAEIIQLRREKKQKRERSKSVKCKKWKEKDKKILLDRVKNIYLSIKKIRMNIIRVDPMVDERKRHDKIKKRMQKQIAKKDERKSNSDVHNESFSPDEVKANHSFDNKITLDLEDEEMADDEMHMPELKEIPSYYKFANPLNVIELEWKVTLSRYDFPWQEICFEPYSAKECYKMYTSIVTDVESFLKKVLSEKPKYQKMIQNQLNGLPIFNLSHKKTEKPTAMFSISHEPGLLMKHDHSYPLGAMKSCEVFNSSIIPLKDGGLLNTGLYCMCKGRIQSDFMVACEMGEEECVNGGWVHPQCTKDICNLSMEEIDKIEVWYCEDCQQKLVEKGQRSLKVVIDQETPENIQESNLEAREELKNINNRVSQQTQELRHSQNTQNSREKRTVQTPTITPTKKPSLILSLDVEKEDQQNQQQRQRQQQHQQQQQQQLEQEQEQEQEDQTDLRLMEAIAQYLQQQQARAQPQQTYQQMQLQQMYQNLQTLTSVLQPQWQQPPIHHHRQDDSSNILQQIQTFANLIQGFEQPRQPIARAPQQELGNTVEELLCNLLQEQQRQQETPSGPQVQQTSQAEQFDGNLTDEQIQLLLSQYTQNN